MRTGDVEENAIDLIKICDASTLGYNIKVSKSSIRMKLLMDKEGKYAKWKHKNAYPNDLYDKSYVIIIYIFQKAYN